MNNIDKNKDDTVHEQNDVMGQDPVEIYGGDAPRRDERGRHQKTFFSPRRCLAAFMAVLMLFSSYVMADTFLITRVYSDAETSASLAQDDSQDDSQSNSQDSSQNNSQLDSQGGMGGKGRGHGPGGMKGGKGRPGSHDSSDSTASLDSASGSASSVSAAGSSSATGTTDTYKDDNMTITLREYRQNDTSIYVADVQLSDPSYLRTALAQGSYGRNVTAKTSEIAKSVDAVLAVNGDYYGAQESGYVIRNGKLYRSTAIRNQEDLVIYKDGTFGIINESDVTAEELIKKGAVQTLSFGPALVQNGKVTVSEGEEVGKAMASNPRTAIGIIDENHYVFVVSDGRTSESSGLSLNQLAQFMQGLGVETAYNLDGGGSSTMYFKGSVVNNPTTGGNTTKERSVSDIVYIG